MGDQPAHQPQRRADKADQCRQEEDEAILFDPRTGEIKLLNETGAFIYQCLDGKHTRNDIVDELVKKYDILEREVVEADVDEFLRGMRGAQLIGDLE